MDTLWMKPSSGHDKKRTQRDRDGDIDCHGNSTDRSGHRLNTSRQSDI